MSNSVVSLERDGRIGLMVVDKPPLNLIDREIREGLADAITTALRDPGIDIVLLCSQGPHFMAGVDISEFDGVSQGPSLASIQLSLERAAKPVVVALQGMALGGGLELALACHYRVVHPEAKLGLPEIHLGVIPGAGGTQRLPRLIGARKALGIILSGIPLGADEAQACRLADQISTGDLREDAKRFCRRLMQTGASIRRTGDLVVGCDGFDEAGIAEELENHARALKGRTTQNLIIEAINAAVSLPLSQGLEIEARLARESLASRESRALRHLFFAERAAGKIKTVATGIEEQAHACAAVIGAGTMGSGIATALADAGLAVTLIDSTAEGLARGQRMIQDNYRASVARRRITQQDMDARLQRITGSLTLTEAASADFVIEAVYENLELKQGVLRDLDAVLASHKLIASNTSTLSVTELGRATRHPERVAGLHFFSPAHVMRLVEVVRGADTSTQTLTTALRVTRVLKKIGVVTNDGYGFIGNRMMLDGYFREAEQLLLEGCSPEQVDQALEAFGFAMGPHKVSDLGGLDVGTKARQELYRFADRPDPYFVIADRLTQLGRLGQKSGAGFYAYPNGPREAVSDAEVAVIIRGLAAERNIAQRAIGNDEIVERCLLSLVNVGASVLDEGIAQTSADIDVVWTSGYGFPRHYGGPMFYADSLGLEHVCDRIRHYHRLLGHYWRPARLIEELARTAGTFAAHDRAMERRS